MKENILPIQESGHLKLIEEEGEYIPNITFKLYNGHTEGQLIPYINYNGKTVAFMADLMLHRRIFLCRGLWHTIRGLWKRCMIKSVFYAEALENDIVLFLEHDLYNEACTLHNTPKGVRVKAQGKLAEFVTA